jgi:hypothetical protein
VVVEGFLAVLSIIGTTQPRPEQGRAGLLLRMDEGTRRMGMWACGRMRIPIHRRTRNN